MYRSFLALPGLALDMPRSALLVFARRPELGRVKTRLAAAVGEATALALHRAFLGDTLEAARRAGTTVVLAHTPGPPFPEQELADLVFEQEGASFGARLDAALAEAVRRLPPSTPLAVVGADTPHLGPGRLRAALEALDEAPAVLGPSQRGGFYLLGFGGPPVPVAAAFQAENEAAGVERLLKTAGLECWLLEPFFDVDEPADLVRLAEYLEPEEAAGAEWVPSRTKKALEGLEGLEGLQGPR